MHAHHHHPEMKEAIVKRVPVMIALASLAAFALLPVVARATDEKADKPDKSDDAGQAAARSQQAKPDAEGFYSLFDGKSLDGWKANENPQSFKVQDGNIVVNGQRSHLFYVGPVNNHDFKDFHFKAEVMTFPNSNSGIYFHTKYQDKGFPNAGTVGKTAAAIKVAPITTVKVTFNDAVVFQP